MTTNIKDHVYKSKEELILFHLLKDEEMDKVIPFLEIVDYAKGATVFNEGDPGNFIGFIISGSIEIKKQTEFKDRQIVIAVVDHNSFVGELSLINQRHPRPVTAVALENSELIILTLEALETIIKENPEIGVKILRGLNQIMSIRMRHALDRLASIF